MTAVISRPLRAVLETLIDGRSLDERAARELLIALTDGTLAPALAVEEIAQALGV